MRPPGPAAIDPIIDFSHLENASLNICDASGASQINELLKAAKQLQSLFIDFNGPLLLAGLGSSLAAKAYRTLKSVKLHLAVGQAHYSPLCGLTLELRQLSGNNVLEELDISVLVGADEPCRTEADDWSDLDALLTVQGAFPMLHRVTVKLSWFSDAREEEQIQALFHRLTQDRFPQLLKSSAVQFEFYEEHDSI
ncbi:hypothetical protein HYPSUDRAFT_206721 [Hypholoma sublateritium FD-334 SS-4]|uniref:F-box domain-containing protein n=1 Tax=Hypholoma sublateritium (strain FD-334 SS-4) TaxID=945553 RepID=A0A0D2NCK3_HYPSF|nr:hypothetical protein HYPSUDRAFT_206721 [Hypholoma sublateritium FD-334 SS-4]